MQFYRDGQIYKASHVSGPTHNFLAIKLGTPDGNPNIEPLIPNPEESIKLHSRDVQEAVMDGIRKANNELGTDYQPVHIQFVASDTPPADIYSFLARKIIQRLHYQPNTYNGID